MEEPDAVNSWPGSPGDEQGVVPIRSGCTGPQGLECCPGIPGVSAPNALPLDGSGIIRIPVKAGGSDSGAAIEKAVGSRSGKAQAGEQAEEPAPSSVFHSPSKEFSGGAQLSDVPVLEIFLKVFHVQASRGIPLEDRCREMFSFPPCSLQLGISLAQLLLYHPRDGAFVHRYLKQTWTKRADTPIRGDMLPFQFFSCRSSP